MDFDVFMYVRQYIIGFVNALSLLYENYFWGLVFEVFRYLNLITEHSEASFFGGKIAQLRFDLDRSNLLQGGEGVPKNYF